jgi:hypothetical protein
VALAVCLWGTSASAHPPLDDYLNPQPPGAHLVLTPFVGPGFRAAYDHRFELEKDMSELRVQLIGTVAFPFAEASANVDVRFFLMTFGATVGYHDEWHLLQFRPDPGTGRDRAGKPPTPAPPGATLQPNEDPAPAFTDLNRAARASKDQYGDVQSGAWPFYEGRWGFVWPGYGFMGVSTLTAHYEARPDMSYDWQTSTVYSGGLSFRWEGYFLLRDRNAGFIGPALRVLYVPRDHVERATTVGAFDVVVPEGIACRHDEGVPCRRAYEAEAHYGIVAGLRPRWSEARGADTLLVRVYAAWGLNEPSFGNHVLQAPLDILVAYTANIDL